ncbi:MAG: hypothetical protein GXO60_05010 [Epsilonproteobacteria bacterium]|nr:hypothetical protein [Campylobacterota bacterium]
MKNISNSKIFTIFIYLLTIAVIAKLIWFIISLLFLPKNGIEHIETTKVKPLYYRIKLANQSKKIKPTVIKTTPIVGTMRGIKLLALYNSKETLVVTVEKNNKTKVLSKGEDIDGFKLTSAGVDYAIFTKGNKEFKLMIDKSKIKTTNFVTPATSKKNQKQNDITNSEDGEQKIVSKKLLTSYTKNIDKVWKDIGVTEHKKNNLLDGFKVNFVRRGSDFEKLGLKRGDILKAVNGQELNSYNTAFSFYKDIDNIESLTLSIIRNNQDMELEYEIK